MKVIVLGCGAKVDEEFYPLLSRHNWSVNSEGYVSALIGSKTVMLHNLVMGPVPPGRTIDHIDRDKLNNTLANMRFATWSEQNFNQGKRRSNTGVCGVHVSQYGTFTAQIFKEGKRYKKSFRNMEDAVSWRQEMIRELYPDYSEAMKIGGRY